MKHLLLLAISILFAQTTFAQKINVKESKVSFEVMNRGKVVQGTILNVKGEVVIDETSLGDSHFSATVDPKTIDTGIEGRDEHLQKDDFFEVASFPEIKMVSKSIAKTDAGYEATATLTIKDVSVEVTLPFTITTKDGKQTLEGKFSVNRNDYKLGEGMSERSIGFDIAVTINCVVDLK